MNNDREIKLNLDEVEPIIDALKGKLEGRDPREQNIGADGKLAQAKAMWDKIKKFKNNPTVVEQVEHDGIDLPIRILSSQELIDCQMEANQRFNKIDISKQFADLRLYYLMVLVITKSLTSSPQSNEVAPFSEEFVMSLPMTSLIGLYRKWEQVQEKYNCNLEQLSKEDFNYLLDFIEKKTPRALIEITYSQLLKFTQKLYEIHMLHKDAIRTQ